METTWKRLLSLGMALLMVLSLVPFNGLQVYAADTQDLDFSNEPAIESEEDIGISFVEEDIDVNYPAKIGDQPYSTFEAALAAAEKGDTVTLLTDVQLTKSVKIAAGEAVTLDLNGYDITSGYQTDSAEKHIYPFDVYGELTIKDTKGEGSISGRGIYVRDGAKLTVESGTIYGIDNNGGSALYQYGGDIIINGGKIEQTAEKTTNYAIYAGGGTVTVNGGTVVGKHGALSVTGAAAIVTGGELICTGNVGWTDNVIYVSDGSLKVTGGKVIHKGKEANADSGAAVVAASDDAPITISGGTFVGYNGSVSGNANTTISGGNFSTSLGYDNWDELEKYVAPGATIKIEGNTYTKEEESQGLTGEGTETSPYLITDLEELILFRDSVNAGEGKYNAAYVKLDADIDLSSVENWVPIGNVDYNNKYAPMDATKVFSGVFDGNDKVISSLKMTKILNGGADAEANLGLFGITGDGAVIKDLTITNVDIETDGRNVGALVAFAYKATLENITVNGDIQIKGGNNVSGVCAMSRHNTVSVTNVTVVGDDGSAIVGNNIVGGIFAEIAPNGTAQTFKDLRVENVAITGVSGVGGIVGLLTLGTVENVTVKNVALTGKTEFQGDAMGRIRLGSVAGLLGNNYATIANAAVMNVTGKNLDGNDVELPVIGANYSGSIGNATEAKIGDTYYATVELALKAAQAADTVTLLQAIVIGKDETKTIDLPAGVTVSLVTDDVEQTALILNYGNLTITGEGKLSYRYTGTDQKDAHNTIESAPGSVLTITGGEIENLSEDCLIAYAVDGLTNGGNGDVTVNIEGGKLSSKKIAVRIFANSTTNTGYLNISGGEISGRVIIQSSNAKANKAELNITGGTFNTNGYKDDVLYVGGSGAATAITASVSGGTFNGEILSSMDEGFISGGIFNAPVAEEFCAEGYVPVNNGDGTYGVNAGLRGSGTEEDPYLITDLEELILFRNSVNAGEGKYNTAHVKLAADIDLSSVENWEPIGNVDYNNKYAPADTAKVFSGVFDGNDKVISNLKMTKILNGGADAEANLGLFGITGDGAVIKDLTITNVDIETDGRNVGALVAFAYKATLENITVNGDIQIKGGNNVSGVCAMSRHNTVSVTNVTVVGDDGSAIVGNNIVGGIFAEIAPNGTAQTFKDLRVENVAITGVSGVGGIVGLLTLGTVENVTVKNVALTGKTEFQGDAMGRIRLGSVAGLLGNNYATIANAAVMNVTGKNLDGNDVELPVIGANYSGSIGNATEAKIGDTYYATVELALKAAQAGDTVTLLTDVELTNTLTVPAEKKITLDLNGKVIDGVEKVKIAIMSYGDLTLKDSSVAQSGAIKAGIGTAGNAVNICAGSFTMESGSIYSKNNAILVDEESAVITIQGGKITAEPATGNSAVMYISSNANTTVNITGGEMVGYNGILMWNNNTINMSSGSIEAKGSLGIQGNGSKDNTEINISGDASVSGYYAAIYHPQGGKLNISENAVLTGWTGIVVKGGNVNISGGTISGTGAANAYVPVSSGFQDTGDGLYIEHYDNSANSENYGTPAVTVTGGTFTSVNGKAVASYANSNNDVQALTGFISGGTYNTDVTELCAPGYEAMANGDGTYTVKVTLPEVLVADIKGDLKDTDPDLTFALNFAIPNVDALTEDYLNDLFEAYGDHFVDYVLTIEGLNGDTVTFNANGDADGYLAGQYDAWSDNWVSVPFDDVEMKNGESLYIMEYAAKLMGKTGLRFTLAEVATIVQNFDCGVYFTPEFLAAHPNMKVTLQLKVFTEDAEGNKIENIDVATNVFENSYAAAVTGEGKQTTYYATLTEAYNAAAAGDTIELLKDAKLTGKLTMTKSVTIDGNGNSIIADETATWYTGSGFSKKYSHLLGINADSIALKDVVLDCNNNAAGINVYCAQNVVFDNMQIINATKGMAALTVNGSTVTAKSALTISGNSIAIDISNGSGVTSALGMTIEAGTVTDLSNKTVKFASVANNSMTGAVKADGTPYFAAMDNAYYYTQAQIDSRTNGYSSGLTLLDDVTLSKDVEIKSTLDLNGNDLTIADGKVLKVSGALTVTGEGNIQGAFLLTKATATLTAPEGLDVTTNVADYRVVYEGGVYVLEQIPYVAQVGETKYMTLQAAIDAAGEGDTVTVLTDIELTEAVKVAADKTITLDLGGKTVTGKPAEAKAFSVIENKGNLTLTNGTILCDHQLTGSTGYAVNTITNGGTLIIDGATVENKSTASNQIGYAIDNNSTTGNAIVKLVNGEVKASGSNYYDGIRQFCNSLTNENTVTVEGGAVSSIWLQNPSDGATEKDTKEVKGAISITDGNVGALYLEPSAAFEAEITGGYVGSVSYFTTSEGRDLIHFITGGTFGMDVTAFCAPGYKAEVNGDGTYTVVVNEAVVAWNMQTGEEYETVAAALNAAAYGQTVQMLADSDEATSVLVVFNGITLDLNGKQLTALYAITTASEAGIIDSADAQGLLKVAKTNLTIQSNAQLPVWIEEEAGFRFAVVTPGQFIVGANDAAAAYAFYIDGDYSSDVVAKELADGSTDGDGLSVVVRMYYTDSNGVENVLTFAPPADRLMQTAATWYTDSPKAISMTVYGIGSISDISFQTVYAYGNTQIVSERLPLNAE